MKGIGAVVGAGGFDGRGRWYPCPGANRGPSPLLHCPVVHWVYKS